MRPSSSVPSHASSSSPPPAVPGDDGSPDLVRRLCETVDAHNERLVRLRRRLHATPEPSDQEIGTTALVAETLREAGLQPRVMEGDVGVLCDLSLGAGSGTFIALRSELDCVEVNDDKQVPYASTRPGLCHACGHDAHTTVNLAVATVLSETMEHVRRIDFRHDLRFVFQPAEEKATGARSMIRQGALDGVESIIALHADPFIDTGSIGLRVGALTSACKSFRVVVRGRGGHSARPYEAVDPIPAATMVVDLFYQLGPRSMDSRYPLVLTVSSIRAGSSYNAIPDQATVIGTLRASRIADMEAVQRRMSAVVKGAAEASGCDIELEFLQACPATDNDARVLDAFRAGVGSVLGDVRAIELDVPSLGGEDFAFYQELIPGAMIRLGAALPEVRARRPLHSSHFDIDEPALAIGAKVMTLTALQLARRYEGHHA